MTGFRWGREPSRVAFPSPRRRDRLKFWESWGGSSTTLPASVDQEHHQEGVVTEPSTSSRPVDRPALPAVPKTSTVVAESNSTTTPGNSRDRKSLWDLAYDALRQDKPEVVEAYEGLLFKVLPTMKTAAARADFENLLSEVSSNLASTTPTSDTGVPEAGARDLPSRQEMMKDIVGLGQSYVDGKRIAFNIGRQQFMLRDQMGHVITGIQLGKSWIDEAVKASPLAGAAWAGVCLLLPLLTNLSEVQTANEEGLAYVAQKIRYYTAMESLLLGGPDEKTFTATMMQEHEELFVKLYQAIIDFQAQSVLQFFRRRFRGLLRDAVKWDPWEEMLKKVKELGNDVEGASLQINTSLSTAALGDIARWARQSEEGKCLETLSGDYAWYKGRVEARVPDTCRWFLNHASYQSWLEARSGPLLVSADPGCGKSVLAKYLIDSSFGFRVPKEAAICYFFFKDGDRNTLALALSALIHQLLCRRPQLMHHAMKRFRQEGQKLASNVTALWDILQSATADPTAGVIIIVLDALDECSQDELNMATLSRYIQTHFNQGSRHMKIIMTSRPYQNTVQRIQGLEESFPNIRINGEDESEIIREEINSVIEFRVGRMTTLDVGLKKHLKERLLNITHRTYLWLYLVFEYLESSTIKSTTRGLDKAIIQNLPNTVEDAYEKILSRCPAQGETRKAMLTLLAASRPLTLGEMQIALGLNVNTRTLEELDLEPDDKFKNRLRELCGLFVTVHDNKVYFLHQTVREFLLPLSPPSPSVSAATKWAHEFSMREAHLSLAESCVVYLHLLDSRADRTTQTGILDYSTNNWVAHFRDADPPDDAAIVPLALRICDPELEQVSQWLTSGNGFGYLFENDSLSRLGSLAIATRLGLTAVVKRLLNTTTVDINQRDVRENTPLLIAIREKYDGITKLLLDTGQADINIRNRDNQTPLVLAAERQDEGLVKLLTTNQADVNIKDSYGYMLLLSATLRGDEGIAKLLLSTGRADINPKDRYGHTPLSSAAQRGYEGIVKLLLNTDQADIDSKNDAGNTALMLAARGGYEGIVQLLFNTGQADINSKNLDGCTPLMLAAQKGNEGVVKLLLNTGQVDINSKNHAGETASLLAALYGHEAVVHLLQIPPSVV
ncbi:putative ankyrin repeat protein [Rosellinia necatrix]|uniref:Putative ankyrin repeat protein n=1 Tax=Rosellinia necatrix TaxID=77044 RepID=A0A1W2TKZ1_ROSNE|nr:putative ankyrin repeat protein [Rosellinia necatrix]